MTDMTATQIGPRTMRVTYSDGRTADVTFPAKVDQIRVTLPGKFVQIGNTITATARGSLRTMTEYVSK